MGGARVVLTDLPRLDSVVTGNIALNLPVIRAPASATFCPLDWNRPRASVPAAVALHDASIVIASDPVSDGASQAAFFNLVRAMLGLDGERPLCTGLQSFIVAHKHQQNTCIAGYVAPGAETRPAITLAEECSKCAFRRSLEEMGVSVTDWHPPPEEFAHPFVDCWCLTAER